MANEITLRIRMQLSNGNLKEDANPGNLSVDQTTQGSNGGVLIIGQAAEETISFTDITSEGYLYLRNLDGTNYIKYGPDSGGSMVDFGKLKAGECAVLRLYPGLTLKAQADTADCKLQYLLLDD